MDITVVILVLIGIVFVYASIKDKDPRDLVKSALKKKG